MVTLTSNPACVDSLNPGFHVLQDGDLLWFSGSIENVYFVLKITGLEHHQASQIGQLKVGILNRQLVQVSDDVSRARYDVSLFGLTGARRVSVN